MQTVNRHRIYNKKGCTVNDDTAYMKNEAYLLKLYSKLLCNVLRKSALVDQDVHSLVCNESL